MGFSFTIEPKEKGCIEETYGMDLEEDLDEIEK